MADDVRIQWHPVFASALRLELQEYEDILEIQEEYQLTRKPLEIDILVIRKKWDAPLIKNLVKLFRGHNIIEYKSPEDYLSIDDFYKVRAYAFLYKVSGKEVDSIPIDDITISCVLSTFPQKLINYLMDIDNVTVINEYPGIYYVEGLEITTQIIVIDELSKRENRFVRLLTKRQDVHEEIGYLIQDYPENRKDKRYEILMDLVLQTHIEQLTEVLKMSKALTPKAEELIYEVLSKFQIDQKIREAGREEGREAGREEGRLEGIYIAAKAFIGTGKSLEEAVDLFNLPEPVIHKLKKELQH